MGRQCVVLSHQIARTPSAIFMIIRWLALPGVLAGIDDSQLAPWYVNAGLLSWMGTYLLYPPGACGSAAGMES